MLKVIKVLALGLLVPFVASVAAPGISVASSTMWIERVAGETCDNARYKKLVSVSEARGDLKEICGKLGEWDIARLADGASLSGRGYKCEIKVKDDRKLGHSLCHKKVSKSPFNKR